ncbi:MAG: hypothetical protein M3Q65_03565 [Chloroflexota bacterium]|nr:hypothetical protein [Chloroflexota bacterium]
MAGIIEIWDRRPDSPHLLALDLLDLLPLVAPEGRQLVWAILELEGEGVLPNDRYRQETEDSPTGAVVSWDELIAIARAVKQVLWGVFVGCTAASVIPRLHPDTDLYSQSEIVIEAIDSTYWRVYARDDRVLQRLGAAFREVKMVALSREA